MIGHEDTHMFIKPHLIVDETDGVRVYDILDGRMEMIRAVPQLYQEILEEVKAGRESTKEMRQLDQKIITLWDMHSQYQSGSLVAF